MRELNEELSISKDDIQLDENILFVTVGAVVTGVPKANLFYRAELRDDKVISTSHVLDSGWFTSTELLELFMSPTNDEIKAKLVRLIEA